ncbi:hypothetical protein D9C73_025639 [Scomber scombrus]|uniref:Uncharacterized protein n=1 Tax=Scomber scombrus TaxID=13677 RepID=A0AAV1PMF5_SCOSC
MADHRNEIRRATQHERKEHMDGKDKLLWRHSAFAGPFRFMVVRWTLPLLQPDVLNNCTMDSSLNGHTAGGCTRKAFKLKPRLRTDSERQPWRGGERAGFFVIFKVLQFATMTHFALTCAGPNARCTPKRRQDFLR